MRGNSTRLRYLIPGSGPETPASRLGAWARPLRRVFGTASLLLFSVAQAMNPQTSLEEGWWRGAVNLDHGPVEFFLEVGRHGPLAPQIKVHTEAIVADLTPVEGPAGTLTLASGQLGERMEGELRGGAYLGRYFPSKGGPAGGFSFRAHPAQPWEATPPLKVWNLTGVWILQTGPAEEVEIVLAHRDRSLRAIWKERDGTVRYLAGRLEGQRFAMEVWRGSRVVMGRYTPDGILRGEWKDDGGGSTVFQMRRKVPAARAAQSSP